MLSAFGNEDDYERTVCIFIACEGTIRQTRRQTDKQKTTYWDLSSFQGFVLCHTRPRGIITHIHNPFLINVFAVKQDFLKSESKEEMKKWERNCKWQTATLYYFNLGVVQHSPMPYYGPYWAMEAYGRLAEYLHINTYYQAMFKCKVKSNLDLSAPDIAYYLSIKLNMNILCASNSSVSLFSLLSQSFFSNVKSL